MKYVLLGRLSENWAARHDERVNAARAKLDELGITLDTICYTQGRYDFVDVVETPSPEALLGFSVWYAQNGFGRIESMPAFDEAAMGAALKES